MSDLDTVARSLVEADLAEARKSAAHALLMLQRMGFIVRGCPDLTEEDQRKSWALAASLLEHALEALQ